MKYYPRTGLLLFVFFFTCCPPWCQADDNLETYTHRLNQSTSELLFWTAPPSERIFKNGTLPSANGSSIKVYCAKNETEPFQLIVQSAQSRNITINMGSFGSGITIELFQVKDVTITTPSDNLGRTGPYPDPLFPIENGETISTPASQNTALWVSITVPSTTGAGDYSTTITINGISIPISLHVFNFTLPKELHVKSQMNFSYNTILQKYGVQGTGSDYWKYVDLINHTFISHRLTPKSPLWPGGVTTTSGISPGTGPFIDYDCAGTMTDNDGIWGFEQLAKRYLDGDGLLSGTFSNEFNNGTGYPSFMAATFRNNDPSDDQRRETFCLQTRSATDWYLADAPNSPYNQVWKQWLVSLRNYLNNLGYLDKAYYYFANEPQNQEDYDAIAWYSQMVKATVPNLKLAISEEPRPEIYNHPTHTGAKIDIWMPVLNNYNPAVSHDREKNHNEETWIYFLHGTRPPYFNPITLDHPGVESKFTGWFLWKYRIKGILYYSLNNWSKNPWADPRTDGHNGDLFMLYPPAENNTSISYGSNSHRLVPSIRFELMRDSLEDYEYLYLLNGASQPVVGVSNPADTQADKIISGLTSYTRSSEFMYNLRRLIGLKLGNEIATIPNIQPPVTHPRSLGAPGKYYINFQDPAGQPTATPLRVNSKEYMKIGWSSYSQTDGYGWYGDLSHVKYQYITNGPNALQNSILYDDWGREKTFEFDLPNGTYDVTVSVGWQGRSYQRNKITIEGTSFIDDEASNPYITVTKQVTINDNKLTMAMGIFNEYTMLNYLNIEATGPDTAAPVLSIMGQNPLYWNQGKPYSDPGALAQDNFDGNISHLIQVNASEVNINSLGTYKVYYQVTDSSGNRASGERTVHVRVPPENKLMLLITPAVSGKNRKK